MSSEFCYLSDIANIQGGYAFKSADFKNEGVAIIKIANIRPPLVSLDGVDRVSPEKLQGLERFRLKDGDILMAMTGATVGKVGRFKETETAYLNQRVARISSMNGPKFDDFIYAVISQPGFDSFIEGAAAGSAQANISAAGIGAVQIPKLSDSEQIHIGEIARCIDDRITLLRETNTTLEAIAQALFKSWFVDFDPVHAKQQGRAPEGMDAQTAALFPDAFEESELGMVPKGWRVGTLGDIAQTIKKQISSEQLHSGLNYVGLEHIPRKSLSLTAWNNAEGLESAKAKFGVGDVLFGKLRPYFHKVVIAPVDGVCSTDILVCSPKKPEYYGLVAMQLFSKELIDYADRLSNGAKMPRVNWSDLAAYPLAIPPEEISSSYTKFSKEIFEKMQQGVHQMQTLAKLRDTLLPRLISGQLRLPEAQDLVEEAVDA